MINLHSREQGLPLYRQIYLQIKEDIGSGKLAAGSRVYSKRKLAAHLAVSINTVEAAYAQLVSEGFLQSVPQKGYFVCNLEGQIAPQPVPPAQPPAPPQPTDNFEVDFSGVAVDREKFPYNTWRRFLKNCFNEYDPQLLQRAPAQGRADLRREVASYLYRARGVNCTAEQIIIGAGTDNLLQMLSYILDNTCTIGMENPVYHQAWQIFERMGHRVLSCEIDRQGLLVTPLAKLDNIAVYITPSHQFPLGLSMPIGRRIKLLNWAKEGTCRYIIEDDYDSEFRYGSHPIPAMQGLDDSNRVIYLGTFTKSVAPFLRIGYMVLPPDLQQAYFKNYAAFGSPVSGFEQKVLAEFIAAGAFEMHLNRMRKHYKTKRQLLVEGLSSFGDSLQIIGEEAGHHILVRLRGQTDEQMMCDTAAAAGVRVYPITPYFFGAVPPAYKGAVMLGYGGLNATEIQRGAELLAQAWNPLKEGLTTLPAAYIKSK